MYKCISITSVLATLMAISTVLSIPIDHIPYVFSKRDTCPSGVQSCSAAASGVSSCCVPKNGIVLLTQQWTPAAGPPDAFTLHGLWPNRCDGSKIWGGCDPSRNVETVLDIVNQDPNLWDDMKKYWPSTGHGHTNDWLWSHEWNNHGTCVTTLDPTSCNDPSLQNHENIKTYFRTALQLRSDVDLYNELAKRGIESGSYKHVSVWHQAIMAAYGVDAVLYCQAQTIQEVLLYYSVTDKDHYTLVESQFPPHPTLDKNSLCQGMIYFPKKFD